MGYASLILLGLGVSLYRRSAIGTGVLGPALVCTLIAYGVWASFFGSIFGLPVFHLGMSALLAATIVALALAYSTRHWPQVPPYLLTFTKLVCGALLLYSILPVAFLVWFLGRIVSGDTAPSLFHTLLVVAQPLALVALCSSALYVSRRAAQEVASAERS